MKLRRITLPIILNIMLMTSCNKEIPKEPEPQFIARYTGTTTIDEFHKGEHPFDLTGDGIKDTFTVDSKLEQYMFFQEILKVMAMEKF